MLRFRELMAELQQLSADGELGGAGDQEDASSGDAVAARPRSSTSPNADDRIKQVTGELLALASTAKSAFNVSSHDDESSEEPTLPAAPAPVVHLTPPLAEGAATVNGGGAPVGAPTPTPTSPPAALDAALPLPPAPLAQNPAAPPQNSRSTSSQAILQELRAARLRGRPARTRGTFQQQPPSAPAPRSAGFSWGGFFAQQQPAAAARRQYTAPTAVNAWGGDAATVALVHNGSGASPPTLSDIRKARSDLLQLQLQPAARQPAGGGGQPGAPSVPSATPQPLPTSVFDAPAVDPPLPVGVDAVSGESLALHSPRSDDEANARAQWFYECINVGQRAHLPKGRPPSQMMRDKATLRRHAFQIHYALRHLRARPMMSWANYTGPWIENHWISEFAQPVRRLMDGAEYRRMDNSAQIVGFRAVGTPDRAAATVLVEEPFDFELFYPWVPLFINWEDIYMQSKFSPHIANTLGAELARYILPNVQYITVTQRFQGLFISNSYFFKPFFANILNLAAGGNGHVVLPLLARPRQSERAVAAAQVSPADYPYTISFAGEQKHGEVRKVMLPAARTSPAGKAGRFAEGKFATDAEWVGLMEKTAFQLAPRGVGPTSFRLYEALQMGWVPVIVTDDTVWLPYRDHNAPSSIWNELGHVVHARGFANWVNNDLPALEADATGYRRMRLAILEARDKYFTFAAVLRHIRRFIDVPQASQLRCVPKLM